MTTDKLNNFLNNTIPESMWKMIISELKKFNNITSQYGLTKKITNEMINDFHENTLHDFMNKEANK